MLVKHSSSLTSWLKMLSAYAEELREMPGRVVRSSRSLYGLNQASKSWHHYLVFHMKSLGMSSVPPMLVQCDCSRRGLSP